MRDDFHKKFLVGILILLDQSKKNHTKSNLMYLCIFMLLSISASRELAKLAQANLHRDVCDWHLGNRNLYGSVSSS